MYDYEPDVWVKMIENSINKHSKHIESLDFWVETRELTDKHGNIFSQMFPRLAINFK